MSKSSNKPNDPGRHYYHPYYPFLKWGYLHTPNMIFIRSYNVIPDEDFIKLLGLPNYKKAPPPLPSDGSHIVFGNDDEWTHIADDFNYTLWWDDPKTNKAVASLSKTFDVFRCSNGDIDESFEFEYFKDGSLARKMIFDHDIFKKEENILVNIGNKLASEPLELSGLKAEANDMFPSITKALGIKKITDPTLLRFYLHEKS